MHLVVQPSALAASSAAKRQSCRTALARLRWALVASFTLLGMIVARAEEATPHFGEAKIKAAFVFSFARYIEWPPDCLGPTDAPFVIGVSSRSAVYEELQVIVSTRTLLGRPIVLREIRTSADAQGVHLLFVDRADEKSLLPLLAELPGAGVVTVGESERFKEAGGMLTLHERGNRLRFMVNPDATRKAVVKLSSQLLKLAEPTTKGT